MLNKTKKGLEPRIIKYMAMLIGICYLINPLQEQINSVLHEISHGFDSPAHIISHKSDSNFSHKSNTHFDKTSFETSHKHSIVDVIGAIFKALNENNSSEDSLIKKNKIDKHLVTYRLQFQKPLKIKISSNFRIPQKKIMLEYFEKMKRPPQFLLG
ncbi:MAG: hypothetical protein AB8B59_04485 [Maribacter sp.]